MDEAGGGPSVHEDHLWRAMRSIFLEKVNPRPLADQLIRINRDTYESVHAIENRREACRELYKYLTKEHNWFPDLLASLQEIGQEHVALELEIINDEVVPILIEMVEPSEAEPMEVDEPQIESEPEMMNYLRAVRQTRINIWRHFLPHLNRKQEELNWILQRFALTLQDIKLVGTRQGSLVLLVRVMSLAALEKLRKMSVGGALQDVLRKEILSSKAFAEFQKAAREGGHDIQTLNLSVQVKEEDLQRCERAQRKKAGVPCPSNFLEAAVIGRGESEESKGTIARNFNQLPHKVKSVLDFVSGALPELSQQSSLLDKVAAHLAERDFLTAQENVVKACCSQIDLIFPNVENCHDEIEFLSLNTLPKIGASRECPIELYESPDGEIWFSIHHLRLSGKEYRESSVVISNDKESKELKKRTCTGEEMRLSEEQKSTRHLSFFQLPHFTSMAQLQIPGLFDQDSLEKGVLKFSEPRVEAVFVLQALLRGAGKELGHFHKAELLWDFMSLHIREAEVRALWEKFKDSAFMDESATKEGIFSGIFLALFRRLRQIDLPLAKLIPPIVIFKGDKRPDLCKILESLTDESEAVCLKKECLIDDKAAFAAVLQLLQMKAVLPEGGKLQVTGVCEPVGGGASMASQHQYLIHLECNISAVSESDGPREMMKKLQLKGAPERPECFDLMCEALTSMHFVREVNLTNSGMNRGQVRAVIKAVQPEPLTSLSLDGCSLQAEPIQGTSARASGPASLGLERLYHLETLDVKNTSLGDEGIKVFAAEIKSLGQLRELDLGNCEMTSKGLWSLGQVLKEVPGGPGGLQPSLTALRIQDNDLSKNGAPGLSLVLGNFPQLEILNVSGCRMGDEGAMALSEAVGHLARLKKLSVRENNISELRSQQLFARLSSCPMMQHLDFSQNAIARRSYGPREFPSPYVSSHGSEAVKELLKTLQGSSWWDYLCFFNCGLGGCQFFVETEQMTCLQNLTNLILQDNGITDTDVLGLVKWFPEMKQLHHLNLRQNQINEAGAFALAEAIPQLQRLRELLLDHNEFESSGFQKLVVAVMDLKKIEKVDISNCGDMQGVCADVLSRLRLSSTETDSTVYSLPYGGSLFV